MNFIKTLVLICGLILLSKLTVSADQFYILPKIALILPKNSNIKPTIVLNPIGELSNIKNVEFCMENNPIIAYGNKTVFYPDKNIMVFVPYGFNNFVCLDKDILLFSDKRIFGFLTLKKKISPLEAAIEPISTLPIPNAKMFAGYKKSLYFVGFDSNLYKVYLFQANNKPKFKEIYAQAQPIDSLTGQGTYLILSTGKNIYIVNGTKKILYYSHPKYEIKQLVYTPYGLFYASQKTVGFIQNSNGLDFIIAPNPKLYIKDNTLFVLFPNNMGILALSNINELTKYNYPIKNMKIKE